MKYVSLFFKGLVIGIGKVIPGVSGSFLAISLGVYEETIQRLRCFKNHFKENLFYFAPFIMGIVFSIIMGSQLLLFLYNQYYVYTMMLFLGLLLGTIPKVLRDHPLKFKDILLVFLTFMGIVLLFSKVSFAHFLFQGSVLDYCFVFTLGFVEVVTTMIPGISSTATYMMLGSYEFILNLFSNPFQNMWVLFFFILGFLLGFLLLIRVLSFLFFKNSASFWDIIYAFLFYALYFLLLNVIQDFSSSNLLLIFILVILGYRIGLLFSEE